MDSRNFLRVDQDFKKVSKNICVPYAPKKNSINHCINNGMFLSFLLSTSL
jgi:hypothetical protein